MEKNLPKISIAEEPNLVKVSEKNLPKNWAEINLKQSVDFRKGKKPAILSENYFEDCVPYMDIQGLEKDIVSYYADKKSAKYFKENDVVIVWDGSRSGLILKPKSGAIGSTLGALSPFGYKSEYLFYFLLTHYETINSKARGVGIPHVDPTYLWNLNVPLPPLPEQERIVAKLDLLFTQHEKMKTSLEKIPQILKDFRKQILTQAVTGKLTEEWRKGKSLSSPNKKEITSKIESELAGLNKENLENKRSIFKQNSVLFIRKDESSDWSFYSVESLCVAIVDCLHETAIFSDGGFNIIDTNNIEPFKLNYSKMRYVNDEVYSKWISRLKPRRGDIAFTREANIGNAVMIPENDLYCIGQRTMLFRFSNLLSEKFCEYFMNSEMFKMQYRPLIKGVASQHVNIRDLRLLEIPLPSIQEQTEIVSRVESLFSKIDAIELRYQKLKEKIDQFPQTILHKAFKGELVPQLPTDGDAKDLLKEILALKK